MPKFSLIEKASDFETKPSDVFLQSIHVNSSLPKGFTVGQKIKGEITGKIVSMRESKDESSFNIEVGTLDMKSGKVSAKSFEKMTEKERDKADKDSVGL